MSETDELARIVRGLKEIEGPDGAGAARCHEAAALLEQQAQTIAELKAACVRSNEDGAAAYELASALRPAAEALAALERWLRLPRPPRREVNLGFNSTGQCSCELTEDGEYASVSDGHNSIAAAITAALQKARAGA